MSEELALQEPQRLIGLDLVRATEAAALNTYHWVGRGQKEEADAAATDAIRGMLNLVDMRGTCVIGEGIKDEAPGIFVGEKLGTWKEDSPAISIALDPIEGTTPTSKGMLGALSVIAGAKTEDPNDDALARIPSFYMDKIAVGPQVKEGAGNVRLDAPVEHNLEVIALTLKKRVEDLVVCILDRPRHAELLEKVRRTDASVRLISDGDVGGVLAPCLPDSGVDVYLGIGGSPEAVLAAAALRCLGGEMMCKMRPRDDAERQQLIADGHADDLDRIYHTADLAKGEGIVFVATGVTDGPLLRGVRRVGSTAITQSIVMRSRSHTVRYVEAHHDLRYKRVKLHSHKTDTLLNPRRTGQPSEPTE